MIVDLEAFEPGITDLVSKNPSTKTLSFPVSRFVEFLEKANDKEEGCAVSIPQITNYWAYESPNGLQVYVPPGAPPTEEAPRCCFSFHLGKETILFEDQITMPLVTTMVMPMAPNRDDMQAEIYLCPPHLVPKKRALFISACVQAQITAMEHVIDGLSTMYDPEEG